MKCATLPAATALVQLPVGILLERYDPRKVNGLPFLVAALGAVVMTFSDTEATLTLGRILMGLGFSAAMISTIQVDGFNRRSIKGD